MTLHGLQEEERRPFLQLARQLAGLYDCNQNGLRDWVSTEKQFEDA